MPLFITEMGKSYFIGTSGFSYRHWKGRFYPEDLPSSNWLSYYSSHFNSVEINSTFYHEPKVSTLKNWEKATGEGFLFSVKMYRIVTHIKRLKGVEQEVERFLKVLEGLREKIGPVLIQLPPGLKRDNGLMADFLGLLPKRRWPFAVEFRNKSWFEDSTYQLLKDYDVAFCWHDYQGLKVPHEITGSALFIRFHGPSGRYYGSYEDRYLGAFAREVALIPQIERVFAYFNNDADGHAVANAKTFISLLNCII